MRHRLSLALTLSLALPLFGDEALKPPAQVSSTEHFDFAPGGTIRVGHFDGELYVEAWDQPQVEVTIVKSLPYEHEAAHPEHLPQQLEAVRVVTERTFGSELSMKSPICDAPTPLPLAR